MHKNIYLKALAALIFLLALLACSPQKKPEMSNRKENCQLKNPHHTTKLIVKHFYEQHNNFATSKDTWGGYTLDLTFEAMLKYDLLTNQRRYTDSITKIMAKRQHLPQDTIAYKTQPFASITFTLFEATNDSTYLNGFLHQSKLFRQKVNRSPEGAIRLQTNGKSALLLDYLQEYASRMAKTGYITKDTSYFAETVKQFRLYRNVLRDSLTGLYSQGKGFLYDTMALSPGAWSRGHGWLLRGMVTSRSYLPDQSDYAKEMEQYIKELSDALLAVQDSNGMWHQLLHLPFEDSYPESSGTGMIAYYMALALHKGYLNGKQYEKAALKAICALDNSVKTDGTILHTCKGPGPLYTIDPWLRTPAKPDDKHGAQALIYAQIAKILLNK